MSEVLPVVQKAQPVSLAITPDQAIVVISKEDYLKRNYGKIIWGATYPRTVSLYDDEDWAGYEKREQQLKNKIKELAIEFESWRTTNDSNLGFSFGVFLKQHSEELLGLSKQ